MKRWFVWILQSHIHQVILPCGQQPWYDLWARFPAPADSQFRKTMPWSPLQPEHKDHSPLAPPLPPERQMRNNDLAPKEQWFQGYKCWLTGQANWGVMTQATAGIAPAKFIISCKAVGETTTWSSVWDNVINSFADMLSLLLSLFKHL